MMINDQPVVFQHYLVVFYEQNQQLKLLLVLPMILANCTNRSIADRIDGFLAVHPQSDLKDVDQLQYFVTGLNDIEHPFSYDLR